jgi:thiamine-monophosphate kinase
LGASRAGLDLLANRVTLEGPLATAALDAYRTPDARLAEGWWLAASANVRAMMDCSDGLSTDLARLCAASGVGARIEDVPVATPAAAAAKALGVSATDYALAGGEDFELIATVVPRAYKHLATRFRARFGRPLHRVGEITAGGGMMLRVDGRDVPLAATGYDHFGDRA